MSVAIILIDTVIVIDKCIYVLKIYKYSKTLTKLGPPNQKCLPCFKVRAA